MNLVYVFKGLLGFFCIVLRLVGLITFLVVY